jgi:excinuclease UvrABC nuclease subunit
METGKIYGIYSSIGGLLYVGKTKQSLRTRFNKHMSNPHGLMKVYLATDNNVNIKIIEDDVPLETLDIMETYWINELCPPFNVGKTFRAGKKGKRLLAAIYDYYKD